jgi:uncharacterized protein (TIGR02246 family)
MVMMAALATVLTAAGPAAAQSVKADVEAILDLDRKWVAAVAARDFAWIENLYAPKGQLMPPGTPAATGRDAVGAGWRAMLADPTDTLTFAPKQIHVAGSGDHAHEVGTYQSASGTGDAKTADTGKYVVVWAKMEGRWQVVADIFNSDGPQAAKTE